LRIGAAIPAVPATVCICYAQGKTGSGGTGWQIVVLVQASQYGCIVGVHHGGAEEEKTIEEYSCVCIVMCRRPYASIGRQRARVGGGKRIQPRIVNSRGYYQGFGAWCLFGGEGVREWLKEWSRQDGYDIDDDEGRLRWLGKRSNGEGLR